MTGHSDLPENIARIAPGEPFSFNCSPGIDCFTDCCRQLELALTPYDVLRLRYATNLTSSKLLDRYIIKEQEDTDVFPRFYLTMVDDGKASCVFVTPQGCSIYGHRPGACRTYPLGRATVRKKTGSKSSMYCFGNLTAMDFENILSRRSQVSRHHRNLNHIIDLMIWLPISSSTTKSETGWH